VSDRDRAADWLLSTEGRVARIVFGTGVILIGLGLVGGILGVLMLLIGAVPIASAAYGTLLVGPLLGRDIRGRRPEDQPEEEKQDDDAEDEGDDEPEADASGGDDSSDDDADDDEAPKADPDWSAPPLARAERAPGQEARTRDLRAEDD
jgi:hypothetical protein